jgi:hypothetical protein
MSWFDDPLGPEGGSPPGQGAGEHLALAWRRIGEIMERDGRRIRRLLRRLGRSHARVQALAARLAIRGHRVHHARRESDAVRRRTPPLRFPWDGHARALPTVGLVAVLAVCVTIDYLVDRNALQVLLLPLRVTQALAMFIAVAQTLAAHTVGHLRRRMAEAADPDALHHERVTMWVLTGLVATTVAGLAVFRGMQGAALLGLVMFAVGAAASAVAATAAYLHANSRLSALRTTGNQLERTGDGASRLGRKLLRAEARRAADACGLQASASATLAKVEAVYALYDVSLNGREPPFVAHLRRLAAGTGLPTTWRL